MKARKLLLVCTFLCIIFLPIFLNISSPLFHKQFDVTLNGYFDSYEKPALDVATYVNGEFQKKFESWLNSSIIPKNRFIKLYNQLQYSLFNQPSNRILGKNHDVFEESYIVSELCMNGVNYALPEKDAEMQAYVDKLESISRKLSAFGKSLVVYTTPSKAHYHRENIPDKYLLQAVSGKRGIDAFREKVARTDVPFLDTNLVAEKIAYPVFYKTGIHWSRPVEQATSVELIDLMNNVRGANFRELLLGEIKEQSSPFWKDTDVFDLLNLYLPAEECTYYEYETNRTYPSEFDKLRVLLQGGSFSSGLQHDYFEAYAGDEVHAIFYDESIEYDGGYIRPLDGWDELDLQPLLDQTDIVLIELNEAVVSAYSSGFVEYLDNFLDSYSPSASSVRYPDQRLIPAQNTGLAYSDGFYEYENGIVWATDNAAVTLSNPDIYSKGLEIDFVLNENYLVDRDECIVYLYINQKLIRTQVYNEPGVYSIRVTPEELPDDTLCVDSIDIELVTATGSFCPLEMGLSEDNREMALAVSYIGEVQ